MAMTSDQMCSDPNCNTCAKLRADELKIVKEKSKMLSGKFDCMRCSTVVNVAEDSAFCYCGTCEKLLKQELVSTQKKLALAEREVAQLREQIANLEQSSSSALSKMKTMENAYSEEAKERLAIKVERDEARNGIMCWKALVDHMKAKASCAQCTSGMPCQIMKLLTDQVNSQTPKWDCPDCKEKLSEIAALMHVMSLNEKFQRHCHECSTCIVLNAHLCATGSEYLKAFSRESKRSNTPNVIVSDLWRKMGRSVESLAIFGERVGLIFMNGKYYVAKLGNMKIADVAVLGSGHNPKEACDIALQLCSKIVESTHRVAVEA